MALELGDTLRGLNDNYFNYYLRNARIEAGYTSGQLAAELGLSNSMISHYERLRALPSPAIARKLSKKLNKKISELFPKKIRGYLIQVRHERSGKSEEALDYAEPLPENLDQVPDNELGPFSIATQEEMSSRIGKVLSSLNYREREIIKLRYGVGDGYYYSLEEVGHIFNVTRERIRQIEIKVLKKLQRLSNTVQLVQLLD